jgi:hypothetical protein
MPELRQESHRTQEPEVVLREVPKEPVPRHVRGLRRHDRRTIGRLAQGSPTMQRVCKPARRHPLSAQLHELWREGSCPSEALPMRNAHDRRRLMLQVRKSRPSPLGTVIAAAKHEWNLSGPAVLLRFTKGAIHMALRAVAAEPPVRPNLRPLASDPSTSKLVGSLSQGATSYMTSPFRPRYLGRHRIHHGLTGVVLIAIGLAACWHDRRDFPWPLDDRRLR